MSNTTHSHTRPQVRISEFSQLFLIPYDDAESKWYTRDELRLSRQAAFADAHRLGDCLRIATPASVSQDIINECLGLETFLSQVATRRIVIVHVNVVLLAQRVYQGNERKVEMISEISMNSSRWARERGAAATRSYWPSGPP